MKISHSLLALICLAAPISALAQTAPAAQPQAAAPASSAASPERTRADAYYHFLLGHMDEDMAALTGRNEYADEALSEYKDALKDDPTSTYLATALTELYARTGDVHRAVSQAQDIVTHDPNNLEARRLLGHIYLRSIGDAQGAPTKDTMAMLHAAIEQFEQIVRIDPSAMEDHLLLGRLYRLDGQNGKAEEEFRAAVKLQPSSEEAVSTLALLFDEEGDTGRALDILQSVPEPERTARINSVLAYTYEQKKDYAHAAEFYRKATELDPDDLDALRGLAENLLNQNQNDAALEQYKKIAAADPQDAQTQLHLSELYRRDGQFDKALDALNKAQAIAPDSVEIQYNRALVLESLGKYDEAEHQLNDLLSKTENPKGTYSAGDRNNRAIFLERLGTVYRDENKTQAAVETFRKMLPLGDDAAARAYQQMVDTYRDAKDWNAATTVAKEGVAKFPKDTGLQLVLAGQEADTGQADPAIARVKGMLKGNASDREIWLALAQMYSRQRRYADAEKALNKALELSTKEEDKSYAYFISGSIYERQKKYSEAENYFRKVLAFDPKSATTLNYLGYMLADRGVRLDEAYTLIKRAVALEPQNGAYLDSLGWVQFKMGKYDQAEAALHKAVDRMDNDATVHEHLGDLYQKTNRLKLAVGQWERSLEESKRTIPAEVEQSDVAKVRKKLDEARVKLAKEQGESATK